MMNLFSVLSEILAFGPNEAWQKREGLERVFARNSREMDRDLSAVKRYAAALIAIERSLASELQKQRAKQEPDAAIWRLEAEYRTAFEDRKCVQEDLRSLKWMMAEVCRIQRSILLRRRAAFAGRAVHLKGPTRTGEGDPVRARLQRLLDELSQYQEE
jgi:hypothetical protein